MECTFHQKTILSLKNHNVKISSGFFISIVEPRLTSLMWIIVKDVWHKLFYVSSQILWKSWTNFTLPIPWYHEHISILIWN